MSACLGALQLEVYKMSSEQKMLGPDGRGPGRGDSRLETDAVMKTGSFLAHYSLLVTAPDSGHGTSCRRKYALLDVVRYQHAVILGMEQVNVTTRASTSQIPHKAVNDTQARSPLLSCANRHAHPGSSTSRPGCEFHGRCRLDLPLGQQALPTLAFALVFSLDTGMRSVSPGLPHVQPSTAPHHHSDPYTTFQHHVHTLAAFVSHTTHLSPSDENALRGPCISPRRLAYLPSSPVNSNPRLSPRAATRHASALCSQVAQEEERGEDDGTSATCARSPRRIRAVEHASTCKSESTNLISATTRRSGRRPSTCATYARAWWGCGTDASRGRQQGTHSAVHLHAHIVHDPRPDPGDVRAHGAVRVPPGGVEVAPGEEGTENGSARAERGRRVWCTGGRADRRERGGDAGGGSIGRANVAGGTGDVRELMHRPVAGEAGVRARARARYRCEREVCAVVGAIRRDAGFRIEDQRRASAGREGGSSPRFGAAGLDGSRTRKSVSRRPAFWARVGVCRSSCVSKWDCGGWPREREAALTPLRERFVVPGLNSIGVPDASSPDSAYKDPGGARMSVVRVSDDVCVTFDPRHPAPTLRPSYPISSSTFMLRL
ncbi:hypothetical protein B0H11DRAFT_2375637 [Mycena galericulata]|nr:hypothetical protein B0H11DRAFT_2375637 [Mycena galericulata]